jgi:hypothetical protein
MKQINQKKKKKESKNSSDGVKNGSGKKNDKLVAKKTAVGVKNVPAMKKKGATPAARTPASQPKSDGKKQVVQKVEQVEPKKVDGSVRKDGTVSFMGEDDRMKQNKKERKVRLSAKRAADQRAGHKRRENVPGMRGPKDA